jgi:hypothetical protein
MKTKQVLALAFTTAAFAVVLSPAAEAKGCIKGAIVGGVAGHMAGHGKLGAAAGCVIGHHRASKEAQQNQNRTTGQGGNANQNAK